MNFEEYEQELKLYSEELKKVTEQMKNIKRRLFLQEKNNTIVFQEKEDKAYKVGFEAFNPFAIDHKNYSTLKVNALAPSIDSVVLRLRGAV